MNRRYGNLPVNQPMNPAPRRLPRHPLLFLPRRIDEYTGPTIQGVSRHVTGLTTILDEQTGRTPYLFPFIFPDPTPSGRTLEYQTIGTSRAAQIPDVARGRAGLDSTATTRHARITQETQGVDSYKKGGMVKKTGLAYLHKGEMVVPKKDVNKVKKAMKSK